MAQKDVFPPKEQPPPRPFSRPLVQVQLQLLQDVEIQEKFFGKVQKGRTKVSTAGSYFLNVGSRIDRSRTSQGLVSVYVLECFPSGVLKKLDRIYQAASELAVYDDRVIGRRTYG